MSLLSDETTAALAQNVADIGRSITFRHITRGTGPNPTQSNADYTVKAMVGAYDTRLIDGTTITVKDQQVFFGATDINGSPVPIPTALDQLVIDGAIRAVGIVKPQYIGTVVAMYEVQAKG